MRIRNIFAVLILSLASLSALAQEAGRGAKGDYAYKVSLNPALTSSNAAMISELGNEKLSTAVLGAVMENGEAKALKDATASLDASAQTESYIRISDKVAFFGKLSYSYFKGRNMGGQILLDPSFNPINFLESVDTTAGVKTRELYSLAGGLAYTFNSKWSAGIRIDYQAGNQSKARDPRFLNYWMDLGFDAGTRFCPSERIALGLALRYRHTVEKVKGHIYGTTDKQYNIMTDKGGFWGSIEQLKGDYNYFPESTANQMMNNFFGGSFQLDYNTPGLRFFNDVQFNYRTGYYGRKTSSSPVFFEYSGIELEYDGKLFITKGSNRQEILLSAAYKPLSTVENAYRYNTPEGKSTSVVYTGKNDLQDRTDLSASLGYVFQNGIGGYRPKGEYGVDLSFDYRTQHTVVYPKYRDFSRAAVNASLSGRWNLFSGKNMISPSAGLLFRTGFGVPYEDGSYASATLSMKSFNDWLNKDYEWNTAMRGGASLGLGYTRFIKEKLALEVSVRDTFQMFINTPEYLGGRTRNCAILSVAFNF